MMIALAVAQSFPKSIFVKVDIGKTLTEHGGADTPSTSMEDASSVEVMTAPSVSGMWILNLGKPKPACVRGVI